VEIPMPNSITNVRAPREKGEDAERVEKHAAFMESSNEPGSTSLIQAKTLFRREHNYKRKSVKRFLDW
jgi:hypothetical protein